MFISAVIDVRLVAFGIAAALFTINSQAQIHRDALFGDLHLHTSFSFDAYVMLENKQVTPDVAYRFAAGEPVTVFGRTLQRTWPLDFLAVTDHPENLGVAQTLENPNSRFAKSPLGQRVLAGLDAQDAVAATLEAYRSELDPRTAQAAWFEEIASANRLYRPGHFTTFIGFEWAAERARGEGKGGHAIHRNVIFRGDRAPAPFTTQISKRPEDLWTYLEKLRSQGLDVLTITNHPNLSNGRAFAWEDCDSRSKQAIYASRRLANETLAEMVTSAGDSETTAAMSPGDASLYPGKVSIEHGNGSLLRDVWGRGLLIGQRLGVNPFAVGIVGTSDAHTGLSLSEPHSFRFTVGTASLLSHSADPPWPDAFDQWYGGLTGVWADSNTREGIFTALRRKETFATSGTRLKIRMFGGWTYSASILKEKNWSTFAYEKGVPMGGTLAARVRRPRAPRFIVWAEKAPDGASLDRAQIIKLSAVGASYVEKIVDVARAGADSRGADSLSAVWEDSAFDPRQPAAYYLRVLERPSERWSTVFRINRDLVRATESPTTVQQRAWSSPIWFQPISKP